MKNKLITNATYKNKMKAYCIKCKKIQKILIQKQLEQKIIDQLCNQNVLFAESKNQDLEKNKKQKVY